MGGVSHTSFSCCFFCCRQVRYAILDEADQMLDMGFEEDMEKILRWVVGVVEVVGVVIACSDDSHNHWDDSLAWKLGARFSCMRCCKGCSVPVIRHDGDTRGVAGLSSCPCLPHLR